MIEERYWQNNGEIKSHINGGHCSYARLFSFFNGGARAPWCDILHPPLNCP
ncbi:hypothetical protein BVRB_9g210290 [Beta vulgaris subsp. vulgaris]|nr:hypothetical protein BVRB_9g210290 [Beta vulgaris subsp. vulgaris]